MALNASELLEKVVTQKASDLHMVVSAPPTLRVRSRLVPLTEYQPLTAEDVDLFLRQILTQEQREVYLVSKDLDFSFSFGKASRFRVNAFYQRGFPSVALRSIPFEIPSFETLGLPADIMKKLASLKQGLVLITGPTGQGKSTTIASMVEHINSTYDAHVITIEDPIEYVYVNKKSLIEQRELFLDTNSWEISLRSVLRQDPNVVVIGELRDYESISAAITIAETGHLVISTLHTNSASQTIDRIIGVFPENQQPQIKIQLSSMLEGVLSQRLIPALDGKLAPAFEIMLSSPAIRNLIREGKAFHIDNTISTSYDLGMISMERSLASLALNGVVSLEEAIKYSSKPDEVARLAYKK